jgi:hypothetical protein
MRVDLYDTRQPLMWDNADPAWTSRRNRAVCISSPFDPAGTQRVESRSSQKGREHGLGMTGRDPCFFTML